MANAVLWIDLFWDSLRAEGIKIPQEKEVKK